MTEFILSVASVANGATTLKLIHSLLGDSYGCVNHACGQLTNLAELNINPILDDRRIATGVLYERMKHRTGLSFGNMWTLIEGLRHTI